MLAEKLPAGKKLGSRAIRKVLAVQSMSRKLPARKVLDSGDSHRIGIVQKESRKGLETKR